MSVFKGSTTIDEAEVRGRFEGDLVVHNRLLIKATGRVSGTIRYGQIEIEFGGQISAIFRRNPWAKREKLPAVDIGYSRKVPAAASNAPEYAR